MNRGKLITYVYLVVLILIGVQTIVPHFGDGPMLVEHSYWEHHGIVLLFFLATFPRFALLFSSIASGGILWWLGFLFTPRLLIAILATEHYLQTNPVLVIIAWLFAISGEFSEKEFVRRKTTVYFYSTRAPQSSTSPQVIEAEFEELN